MVSLNNTTIYKLFILAFTIPLYAYGIYQWIKNRRLFIIANRFPAISYLIISGAFMILLSSLIGDILYDVKVTNHSAFEISKFIKIGCTFSLCALSTSRTFLIYLRYSKQKQLEQSSSFYLDKPNATIQRKIFPSHPSKHILFKLMIVYTVIGAMMISCAYWIGYWSVVVFLTSLGVIVIIISIIIFKNHVSDGLGCVKENYFIIIGSVMIIFLSAKFSHDVLTYFGFGFVCLEGFITIYLPLFYVRKIQKQTANKTDTRTPAMVNDNSVIASAVVDVSQLNQHLHVFLRNKNCYMLFRQYLAHCFAIESLMFIEHIVILQSLLIKKQSPEIKQSDEKLFVNHILDIKFDYLYESDPIYKKYKEKVNEIIDFEHSKQIYFDLYLNIFNTFIASDELRSKFVGPNAVDNFRNINDFLLVYNETIIDIYSLMENVYLFNFKTYTKKQKKSEHTESHLAEIISNSMEKPTEIPSLANRLSNLSKKKPSLKNAPSLSAKLQQPEKRQSIIEMPKENSLSNCQ